MTTCAEHSRRNFLPLAKLRSNAHVCGLWSAAQRTGNKNKYQVDQRSTQIKPFPQEVPVERQRATNKPRTRAPDRIP